LIGDWIRLVSTGGGLSRKPGRTGNQEKRDHNDEDDWDDE
jgi:hypothetical protein